MDGWRYGTIGRWVHEAPDIVFHGDSAAHADGCMRAEGPVVPAASQRDSGYAPFGLNACAKLQHSGGHTADDEPIATTGHHDDAINAVRILTLRCAWQ